MLASTQLEPDFEPPKEASFEVDSLPGSGKLPESNLSLEQLEEVSKASSEEYLSLQRRIFLTALVLSSIATLISAVLIDAKTSISLLVGALSGIVYLRFLARGIGKLGKSTKSVGKVQLVIPVLLVLMVSKLPQLELLPALMGFLIYKPSLIINFILDS